MAMPKRDEFGPLASHAEAVRPLVEARVAVARQVAAPQKLAVIVAVVEPVPSSYLD